MVERRQQLEVLRQQHAVAEDVARHVADADHGEHVEVDVLAHHPGVTAHALPGTARRDPHRLVVVAVAASGGECVAEPEAGVDREFVRDVAEGRGALVGGDDEIGVVAVVDDAIGRMDHGRAVEVVGDIEQRTNEPAIAVDAFRPDGVTVGRRGRAAV